VVCCDIEAVSVHFAKEVTKALLLSNVFMHEINPCMVVVYILLYYSSSHLHHCAINDTNFITKSYCSHLNTSILKTEDFVIIKP